jgi:hypothetical protein
VQARVCYIYTIYIYIHFILYSYILPIGDQDAQQARVWTFQRPICYCTSSSDDCDEYLHDPSFPLFTLNCGRCRKICHYFTIYTLVSILLEYST